MRTICANRVCSDCARSLTAGRTALLLGQGLRQKRGHSRAQERGQHLGAWTAGCPDYRGRYRFSPGSNASTPTLRKWCASVHQKERCCSHRPDRTPARGPGSPRQPTDNVGAGASHGTARYRGGNGHREVTRAVPTGICVLRSPAAQTSTSPTPARAAAPHLCTAQSCPESGT